jgi:putative protein kinase ArgK-like GTPase of G3E family
MPKSYSTQSLEDRKNLMVHRQLYDEVSALAEESSLPRQTVVEVALELAGRDRLLAKLKTVREERDRASKENKKNRAKVVKLVQGIPADELERLIKQHQAAKAG